MVASWDSIRHVSHQVNGVSLGGTYLLRGGSLPEFLCSRASIAQSFRSKCDSKHAGSSAILCSRASIAQSFRSKCDSKHAVPCRRQRSPAATPQVGHGTEDNSLGVNSAIRMVLLCDAIDPCNSS